MYIITIRKKRGHEFEGDWWEGYMRRFGERKGKAEIS